MLRTAEKSFFAAVILLCLLGTGGEAQSVLVDGMGGSSFVVPMRPVLANTVMAAYQKAYALNFEVWRPQGMPAGWYG